MVYVLIVLRNSILNYIRNNGTEPTNTADAKSRAPDLNVRRKNDYLRDTHRLIIELIGLGE